MKARGLGRVYQRGRVWWVQYCFRGTVYRETSGLTNRTDAVKLLRRRLEEMGRGRLAGPAVERTTFDDLAQIFLDDYRTNRKRSLDRAERSVAHVRQAFGLLKALDITTDRITRYIADRQATGAANGTINRELAALKRMFRLGERAEKVAHRPHVPMLREDNVRKGFFEYYEFWAVLAHLPEELKPVMEVAYVTGWRIKSEILTRQKHHLDLAAGWLRLDPGETKNGEGRMFPLTPELRAILERQLAKTKEMETMTGRIIPWLFHREREPIKSFRRTWLTACKRAGLPHRIPHDFRRTAVRNLERAGVPRSAAMALVGHKTEAIYRRYAIADETMLREGVTKLAALRATEQREGGRKVISLEGRS